MLLFTLSFIVFVILGKILSISMQSLFIELNSVSDRYAVLYNIFSQYFVSLHFLISNV